MLPQEAEIVQRLQPTATYRRDTETGAIAGGIDGLEAMRQAVEKAIRTERFRYGIYSADYGIETLDLYGQPLSYVCPELERRVTEALCCDERVTRVEDFSFERRGRGVLGMAFTVQTVFGRVGAYREVRI